MAKSRFLWQLLKPYRLQLLVLVCFSLVQVLLSLATPWPLKWMLDNVLGGKPFPQFLRLLPIPASINQKPFLVVVIAALSVVLFLFGSALGFGSAYVQTILSRKIKLDLAARVFTHLQRLSLQAHGCFRSGDLSRRIVHDTNSVGEILFGALLPIASTSLTIILMLVVLFSIQPYLTGLLALAIPPYLLIVRAFRGKIERASAQYQQAEADRFSHAEQSIGNILLLQAFNREAMESDQAVRLSDKAFQLYQQLTVLQKRFYRRLSLVSGFLTTFILFGGGMSIAQGRMTIGTLTIFLSYSASALWPLQSLAENAVSIAASQARYARVQELFGLASPIVEANRPLSLPATNLGRRVTFEQVSFAYGDGPRILHHFSLDIKPGERIALVGPSGSGKTTITSLLMRFYDVSSGRILIDGIDIRELSLSSLRSQLSLMPQTPLLLPISIRENIAYGSMEASDHEIRKAARIAQAHGFIERLPDHYQTLLGERGEPLSGGEIQRLVMARAILRNAPVLILDEPSSAMDVLTEASMMAELGPLMVGKTIMIIAHRLITARQADRIVVLKHGQLVQVGSHDELLSKPGLYAQMVNTQRI